jgi:uncharacterized repeat protein (TIGR01451 family)
MGAYEATLALALHKSVTPAEAVPYHGIVTYTLSLENSGTRDESVVLTDTLPAGVAFGGWASRPAGTIRQGQAISWTGIITAGQGITAVFTAIHTGDYGQVITNTAHASGTIQRGSAEAAFSVQTGHTLSVEVGGAGSGAVGSDPPGIQCGAACMAIYGDGTVVTLTATADAGAVFAGWSGACSGTGGCVLTMTMPRSVTATFDLAVAAVYLPLIAR